MNILQAIDVKIREANNRMGVIRTEQIVLKKELDLVMDKKWELEELRDIAIKAEAERKEE